MWIYQCGNESETDYDPYDFPENKTGWINNQKREIFTGNKG